MQRRPIKDFTVAIVGGGMCGLVCGIGLARQGIDVKIFESTAKFAEVGAGVALSPNALRPLRSLGLLDTVLKLINIEDVKQDGFRVIAVNGDHEFIHDPPEVDTSRFDPEKQGFGIYRPTFLAALLPLVDPNNVFFNKRVTTTSLLPSGQHRIFFSDGTTYDADVIVGADGIKSTVRSSVVESGPEGRIGFSNTYAYRGVMPVDALKAAGVKVAVEARPLLWIGFCRHMATYPIDGRTLLNVAAMSRSKEYGAPVSPQEPGSWVEAVDQQEMLDAFEGSGDDLMTILKHIVKPSRWALHTLYPPLKTYVKDRVVLVGDAAHAMVPYLGAGVGQGFEDVYVLCRLLAHPKITKDNLNATLALYDNLRRPRANMILEKSLEAAQISQGFGPEKNSIEVTREKLREREDSEWHKNLVDHDLDREITNALESF
ncbi:hypothetical protein HYPSUDRAFT_38372 [Hypholoma sublateritium FD-334 SS-4]|uniref:FAD-binding domain-containing protein n=1 Tax=Hypholoma sublateritium (strain FD-334 SS-4) TaxID=945553 RepID=A0A0D2LCJ7_HYPSF|nr:hypothetical protein HYPSUDRAFT_38372 [Hypholoma sublateritium FD-334 SS-4]